MTFTRCAWTTQDPLYIAYHDREWGVPVYDDRLLFEFLVLEGMQAGLSWFTILKKREAFRRAFDSFDPELIARYDERKVEELLSDPSLIRNRKKIEAVIHNARCYLSVKEEFGTFKDYIWSFVGGVPKINHWKSIKEVPTRTAESDAMSRDMKKRGFRFVGSTSCYAYMQSVGMVMDHTVDCFRYQELATPKA